MTPEIERINGEIAALQAEISRIQVLPPTVSERFAVVERRLRQAEQLYSERGLDPAAQHPAEQAQLQRLALIGMCMTIGADKMLKSEHQRLSAEGPGMSMTDKQRELQHLRSAVLAAACRRELALREIEGIDFLPRGVHAELLVFPKLELERIAAR